VVIVGWGDTTAKVSSVTDSTGNAYQLAVGPTLLSGMLSQSIYYAKNIKVKAGTNTVSVNFTGTPAYPDVRILEYSGIDPVNALDVVVGSTGNNATSSSSGTVPTTNSVDLLVGANVIESATTGPGPGFTQRLLTYPDGDIAEDRLVNVSGFYSASSPCIVGAWVMQMAAFRSAVGLPPDTTPPTVNITTPVAGATLTGTATVNVSASDTGTGVAAVQLQIDGVPFGTSDTTSPYTFSVPVSKFAGGTHALVATAWDFANNAGNSVPVSVTFSSSGNPAQTGLFCGTVPLPIVAINAVLLPNNKILMWDGQSYGATGIVWNYTTNTTDSVPAPGNIFCTGQEQMADGRILVVGGHAGLAHVGLPIANIFDPSNESWTALPNMSYARWYPTATMLPGGPIMVTSGETDCDGCYVTVNEIYDPTSNSWRQLTGAPFSFPFYPYLYVLPDGRILTTATCEQAIVSQVLDPTVPAWTSVGGAAVDGGSGAMYLPSKFLKTGKSTDPDDPVQNSVSTAYVLDMTQTSPAWRQIASMAFTRCFHNTTSLPDGNLLVTGGGTTTNATAVAGAILPAELWSPTTETWTTLASMSAPRLYHSEALLLPDGRVLLSGGGRFNDDTESTDQFSAEFFEPPYLFKGPRPVISSAPSVLAYAQNFTVQTPDAARIAKVSLIRFGAATHTDNMSQRFIPLTFSAGGSSLTVTAPVNANLAPPGNYMLFLVDTNGIPSVAAIVHF
jgi:hypothetical protein